MSVLTPFVDLTVRPSDGLLIDAEGLDALGEFLGRADVVAQLDAWSVPIRRDGDRVLLDPEACGAACFAAMLAGWDLMFTPQRETAVT